MTTAEMQAAVMSVYPGSPTWKTRVLTMNAKQVFAVYSRLKREGKIK